MIYIVMATVIVGTLGIILRRVNKTPDSFILGLGSGFSNYWLLIIGAAFNLLIISAVCMAAIPDGEVRYALQILGNY